MFRSMIFLISTCKFLVKTKTFTYITRYSGVYKGDQDNRTVLKSFFLSRGFLQKKKKKEKLQRFGYGLQLSLTVSHVRNKLPVS